MPESRTILGDCMDFLRSQPDKAFDLCLTDPPYNVGLQYSNGDNRSDYRQWMLEWVSEAMRIADVVVFTPGTVNYLDQIIQMRPYGIIPWLKLNQMSGSIFRGFNVWEPVLVYGKPKYVVPQDAIVERISFQPQADFHPCPKSLTAWQKLLNLFAKSGDSVLDVFLGSGTTRIAAYNLGLDFTGVEIDRTYFAAQEARFADHIAQPNMFAPVIKVEQGRLIDV